MKRFIAAAIALPLSLSGIAGAANETKGQLLNHCNALRERLIREHRALDSLLAQSKSNRCERASTHRYYEDVAKTEAKFSAEIKKILAKQQSIFKTIGEAIAAKTKELAGIAKEKTELGRDLVFCAELHNAYRVRANQYGTFVKAEKARLDSCKAKVANYEVNKLAEIKYDLKAMFGTRQQCHELATSIQKERQARNGLLLAYWRNGAFCSKNAIRELAGDALNIIMAGANDMASKLHAEFKEYVHDLNKCAADRKTLGEKTTHVNNLLRANGAKLAACQLRFRAYQNEYRTDLHELVSAVFTGK